MPQKICHRCKETIVNNNYLGNEDIGFIHLSCLESQIKYLKSLQRKHND